MNKIGFKKRTVCAVLVSVICILLASSFVFYTVAEASVFTYSLQGASFGNYINDDGTISSNGLDRSLIDNYSVSAQNQYALSGNYDTFGTPFPQFTDSSNATGFAYTGFDDVVYVVCNGSSSTGTVTATFYSLTSVFTRDVMAGSAYLFSDECYFVRIDDKFYIYDYDGNLLITLADSPYSRYCYGLYTFENKIFVCRGIKTSSSSSMLIRFYVYDGDTYSQLYYKAVANLGGTAKQRSCVFLDGSIYFLAGGNVWVFDCSNYALSQSYSVTGDIISSDGKHIYIFSGSTVYVHDFDFSLIQSYSLSLSVSVSSYVATAPYLYDSFFVLQYNSGYYNFIPLSKSNQYYTDFSAHFVDSFTPSKWINFSCRPSTDGCVVGGNAVSIKLDYALSDEYLSTVYTYGVKVSGCTMLASLDDLSTGTGYYGLPPLVVKVNGSVVPRITKQYESVEKVGDVYLYAFSAFCDFQGSTKINSLEIYMNCFVPEQLSRHSFSLPVSDVELYLEPVGGGESSGGGSSGGESSGGGSSGGESSAGGSSGGESSGGGSSGGESSGTPSVDPGESSDDVPGENDPAFLKIYKVSSGGTLSYIRYFPTAQLSKVSVFFGSLPSFEYSQQGIYAISPSSSFLVLEYVDSGQRVIELDFYAQGWSKTPSLSSMHYPLFTGNVIEIDFSNTYSIYLADVVPYGQMRICDYDNTTYSLVNLPAPDSVVNISQYSDTQFQVSCQGSVRYYPGKIARYKEYGFGTSTSWQLYEEGAVLQFSWLGSPLLNTVQLQTYTGEFPPHDPDYEEQIRIEESIRAELESRANEIYGSVSFDPQDESDFDEAKQDVTDVLGSGSVFFNFVNKLWNTNPFTSHFVVITATCAILAFVVRKL